LLFILLFHHLIILLVFVWILSLPCPILIKISMQEHACRTHTCNNFISKKVPQHCVEYPFSSKRISGQYMHQRPCKYLWLELVLVSKTSLSVFGWIERMKYVLFGWMDESGCGKNNYLIIYILHTSNNNNSLINRYAIILIIRSNMWR
jgi:hypothetical protein